MSAKTLSIADAKSANLQIIEDGEKGNQAVHDLIVAYQANRRSGSANQEYWMDDRVVFHIGDPKRFLSNDESLYDLTVVSPHEVAGLRGAPLSTLSFFREAEERLGETGILAFWVPLVGMAESHLQSILGTARQVFPHLVGFHASRHQGLVVVAGRQPLRIPAVAALESSQLESTDIHSGVSE